IASIVFVNPTTGYATGDYGMLKSTNGGADWKQQASMGHIYQSVSFANENTGWAAGSFGSIIKTTNGGQNWFEQSSGVTLDLKSIHFSDENSGWASGFAGVILRTTNGGVDWTDQRESGGTRETLFSIFSLNNKVGWTVGLSATILKTISGGEPVNVINLTSINNPSEYIFISNYPNPFNPKSRIIYQLPPSDKKMFVDLTIYDTRGAIVENLVNEFQNSGSYKMDFDGSKLPSGVYFCQITAGKFSASRKMILIK
ncbi:MAG: YCF48-related protein, partial [Ignavibacteria bacterium]